MYEPPPHHVFAVLYVPLSGTTTSGSSGTSGSVTSTFVKVATSPPVGRLIQSSPPQRPTADNTSPTCNESKNALFATPSKSVSFSISLWYVTTILPVVSATSA